MFLYKCLDDKELNARVEFIKFVPTVCTKLDNNKIILLRSIIFIGLESNAMYENKSKHYSSWCQSKFYLENSMVFNDFIYYATRKKYCFYLEIKCD